MIAHRSQVESRLNRTQLFTGFIPCIPLPKQSVKMGNGHGYVPKRIKDYCDFLRGWWKQHYDVQVHSGPIELEIVFCFPYRKQDFPYNRQVDFIFNMSRVDVENLCKPLLDSMHSIVFKDDKQVVMLNVAKIRQVISGIAIQVNEISQKIVKEAC